ncbi:hypothetical protein CEXT_213891 [Caerostris extrusa]|nr:hypothetical protein CEXT_213891 [Caerostris extrusa]
MKSGNLYVHDVANLLKKLIYWIYLRHATLGSRLSVYHHPISGLYPTLRCCIMGHFRRVAIRLQDSGQFYDLLVVSPGSEK